MAWFRRKDAEADSLDPQHLLQRAGGFRLTVSDVFSIKGRGTVVTGLVESGTVTKGSTIRLTRADGGSRDVEVGDVEMYRKLADSASAGDNVGLLLKGVAREDVSGGDVLTG